MGKKSIVSGTVAGLGGKVHGKNIIFSVSVAGFGGKVHGKNIIFSVTVVGLGGQSARKKQHCFSHCCWFGG